MKLKNKFEKSSKCIGLQFVHKIPHPPLTFEQMKKNNELSGIFIWKNKKLRIYSTNNNT